MIDFNFELKHKEFYENLYKDHKLLCEQACLEKKILKKSFDYYYPKISNNI